jgi:hypothetical protein
MVIYESHHRRSDQLLRELAMKSAEERPVNVVPKSRTSIAARIRVFNMEKAQDVARPVIGLLKSALAHV